MSMKLVVRFLLAATLALSALNAQAEYLGFPNGRSANIADSPERSVEAGFLTGDIADSSYQHFGARVNVRTSPDLLIFGDIAQTDVEQLDGLGFGGGLFYQIRGITQSNYLAMKLSYHTLKLKQGGREADKGDVLSIEGLFSGAKLGQSNLQWYANVGIHKFGFESYDDTEIGFGGGVFMETSFGEFYAGADLIDELTFGLGIRYHLQ